MSQATTAACKLNARHYFYEKELYLSVREKVSCFSGFTTNIYLFS